MISYRKAIDNAPVYQPGKPISETERELGIKVQAKLASNENPLGCPESVKKAIMSALDEINLYPDANSYYLKEKLSAFFSVPFESIFTGSGSEEIIETIGKVFFEPGDEVIMSQYPFVSYRIVSAIMGADIKTVNTTDMLVDQFKVMAESVTEKTKAVVLANPNNPLGSYVGKKELEEGLKLIPSNVLIILDEAYFEYVRAEDYPNGLDYMKDYPNIIVLRTFSKSYGLAGLRVGYAFAATELISLLNRAKKVFNVNVLAQAAAIASLDDQEFVRKSVELNHKEYVKITEKLKEKGISYIPSQTNFILIKTPGEGTEYCEKLLKKGIIVRPMKGYGLNQYFRLSIGLEQQNELFLNEFFQLLS